MARRLSSDGLLMFLVCSFYFFFGFAMFELPLLWLIYFSSFLFFPFAVHYSILSTSTQTCFTLYLYYLFFLPRRRRRRTISLKATLIVFYFDTTLWGRIFFLLLGAVLPCRSRGWGWENGRHGKAGVLGFASVHGYLFHCLE